MDYGPGYFSAMSSIFFQWKKSGQPQMTLDELAVTAADLLLGGLGQFIKKSDTSH